MVGVIDLSSAFVVGGIGYIVAFLATGYWIAWLRDPIIQRVGAIADQAFVRARASDWIPSHVAWSVVRTLGNLIVYLATCRRCLACEAVLVWSLATGWPGWTSVLFSMFVAVAIYEAWARPDL